MCCVRVEHIHKVMLWRAVCIMDCHPALSVGETLVWTLTRCSNRTIRLLVPPISSCGVCCSLEASRQTCGHLSVELALSTWLHEHYWLVGSLLLREQQICGADDRRRRHAVYRYQASCYRPTYIVISRRM